MKLSVVKIKVCGFTREEDLVKAQELGIDYVGFILYPKSPRFVEWGRIEGLLKCVVKAKKVAVMVNPSKEEVLKAFDMGFDLVQLHGEESYSFVKNLDLGRVIKAFRVKEGFKVGQEWKGVYAVLLDAYSPQSYGGTGRLTDWDLAKRTVEEGFRVFLAGGLNPQNVSHAVGYVKPYAVDVSSGVESSPGVKDHKKLEEFINAVKNAPMD